MSKKKQVVLAGLVAASLGMSSQALSQETKHFYGGIGIGQSTVSEDSSGFDGNDTAFKIYGGYSLNKHFSIEAAYLNLGEPDDRIFGTNIGLEATAFNAAAIGTVPLNEAFSLYGRLGVIFWDVEASSSFATVEDSGNDLAYGIGAAFNFSPMAKLRLEWEAADVDDTDFRLLSLSASWSF